MTERKNDRSQTVPKDETLVDRYRPLGLKAVAAAALHQKPKASSQPAKISDRVKDWREH